MTKSWSGLSFGWKKQKPTQTSSDRGYTAIKKQTSKQKPQKQKRKATKKDYTAKCSASFRVTQSGRSGSKILDASWAKRPLLPACLCQYLTLCWPILHRAQHGSLCRPVIICFSGKSTFLLSTPTISDFLPHPQISSSHHSQKMTQLPLHRKNRNHQILSPLSF